MLLMSMFSGFYVWEPVVLGMNRCWRETRPYTLLLVTQRAEAKKMQRENAVQLMVYCGRAEAGAELSGDGRKDLSVLRWLQGRAGRGAGAGNPENQYQKWFDVRSKPH
jgi:hypothetical protein